MQEPGKDGMEGAAVAAPVPAPPPAAADRPHVASLQALRGLAAFWVVLFHVGFFLRSVAFRDHPEAMVQVPGGSFGWLGVDLFFVLSAYLLGQRFIEGRPPAARPFLVNRFLRIAPAYYAAVALALLYLAHLHYFPEVPKLFLNLEFLQNYDRKASGAINPAFWSLGVEMQFYLVLPLLGRLFAGRRWLWALAGCLATTLLWRFWLFDPTLTASPLSHPGLYGLPAFLGHFGLGLAAARIRTLRFPLLASVAAVPLVAVPVLLWIPADPLRAATEVASIVVRPLAAVGMALLVLAAASSGWVQRALSIAPLRLLGDMSYSLYLIHFTVIWAMAELVGLTNQVQFIVASAVASLACGALLYLAVERPAERLRKGRRAATAVVAGAAEAAPPST